MATTLVRYQARRNTAALWTSGNETLLPGEPGYESDTGRFKFGDGTTAWNALRYGHDQPGRFDVRNYGAKGDGSTDDAAAFQAAATAAIAGQGTLVIPPAPGGSYKLASTIELGPVGGSGAFHMNIEAAGVHSTIQWSGGSNAAVFHAVGWKLSHIDTVKIDFTSSASTGLIGWDVDTGTGSGSTTQLSFNNCFVGLADTTGGIGWRLGHVSTGGGDVSFLQWNQCLVNAQSGTTGTRGWINEGGNSLNNVWVNSFGYFLEKMVTNLSDAGAGQPQGDDSMFFYGQGGSQNQLDYEFAVPGAYLIAGGRYELGKRFINVPTGSNHPAVTVTGINLSDYTPTDGKLVSFDRPGTLIWDGNYVRGAATTYTSTAFSLGGFTGKGSAHFRGGGIQATAPFWNNGANNWKVYSTGVGIMNSGTQVTGYFTDLPAVTTGGGTVTVAITDTFNRADSTTTLGTTETGSKTWAATNGTWGVATKQAYNAGGTGNGLATIDAATADHTVTAVVRAADNGSAVVGRLTDTSNFVYILYTLAGGVQVHRVVAGTDSTIASPATGWTVGDSLGLRFAGGTGYYLRNGVILGSFSDATTGTRAGVRADSATARFDDVAVTV